MLKFVFIISIIYNLSAGKSYSFIIAGLLTILTFIKVEKRFKLRILFVSLFMATMFFRSLESGFILLAVLSLFFCSVKAPPYRFILNCLAFVAIASLIFNARNQSGLLSGIYFKPNNLGVAMAAGSFVNLILIRKSELSRIEGLSFSILFVLTSFLTGSRVASLVSILPLLEYLNFRSLNMIYFIVISVVLYYILPTEFLWDKISRRSSSIEESRLLIWTEVLNRLKTLGPADLSRIESGLHNTLLLFFVNFGILVGSFSSIKLIFSLIKAASKYGIFFVLSILLYINVEVVAFKELWVVILCLLSEQRRLEYNRITLGNWNFAK